VIISNPPYIALSEKPTLQAEVQQYDPDLALFGGESGLDPYEVIGDQAADYLTPRGLLVLEFGQGQHDAVQAIMEKRGFQALEWRKDLAGIIRCVTMQRSFIMKKEEKKLGKF